MSMRTIEPWRQKTFGTSFRSTTTIAVTIAVFGLGAITVGAVTHSPPKRVATGGAIMAHWSEPTNEVNAPFIPIIGGASSISGGFNAVTCTSQLNCIAVGADNALGGVVSSTGDGGNDWSQSSTAVGQPVLNAVSCATSSLCIAVGQGASARSTDGGTTWTTFAVPTANTTLLGVQCPSSTACVSVGVRPGRNAPLTGQVLVSSNGGQTWTTPTPAYFAPCPACRPPRAWRLAPIPLAPRTPTRVPTKWSLPTVALPGRASPCPPAART